MNGRRKAVDSVGSCLVCAAVAESIGVTPHPEVNMVELTPEHAFFVVATDGVWEFLSSQEVVDIVRACTSPLFLEQHDSVRLALTAGAVTSVSGSDCAISAHH